ncbi:bifunctional tRNA (5-methylaminomethyl-2-thiouridine)(34)-methyltransferase MnmD/FAD-dependent 5-carboxymethylaminomethyl-2-thiouridine(34) oxidoreductase MnmC [Amphritea balenae]|uniref:tRNA 5-methylaminomethyl-2-thiouridine biosynthesis bifunctional protein MnmC n=1 Tax=Amphritea balenae TaxID=452629 RepID=A0A3P1SPW3_9GAMM|nr:bifunctional tRNA (5-methylaminomethyl-2-thiouridine)(34)-methyltransferase MnmD/FAD-dependent 5-carboxymethylaminomethyl-2-thiouridine(34) oxidoreductase MnmC [Amphritea balenae]RRC99196.1 bifunctional tRNA (5-methylaminomethyl-2-thiouridine)(34)-methyltransferase MnmD/FAD-dependent 5-carboxymethylaminomethyl-2-thiouridine(34) oxidoreductase MnmC [Amphritea balenae]GGK73146.1 tRNA 5-methylaminomethyl-2-thiouridine biosynthesis bifunctional protein MnmC [Amphritea balenae]
MTNLKWEFDTPISPQFDDYYFSSDDGLAESEYVYIQGNNLQECFHSLTSPSFTIAETGFGTGLNFLTTWQLWKNSATADKTLHFISVEKYPISKQDLTRALSAWPQLKDEADQLLEKYPQLTPGFHKLTFDSGQVELTLMLGDVIDCYNQLTVKADSWFLDGFAPAKNPDMWTPELFQLMARLSKPDTTFATFTCARVVRDGLKQAGFNIQKRTGFGLKREMLYGSFTCTPDKATEQTVTSKKDHKVDLAWFRLPEKHSGPKTALIIGAGIAGCSTARSLAERGWQVTLIDRRPEIASEGSGNRQGALYAKLPVEPIPASRFHLSGFLFSSQYLKQHLSDATDIWSPCGLLQIACSDKEKQKHKKLADSDNYPATVVRYVDQQEASEIAGTAVSNCGLFFPDAGWVTPPLFCKWLVDHPNISIKTDTEITQLSHIQDNSQCQWQAESADKQQFTAAIAVVASAAESTLFEQLKHLPTQKIRGQVSLTESSSAIDETEANIQLECDLKTVLCGEGYISPPKQGQYCFGATFDLKDEASDIRESGHQHNLTKVSEMAPEIGDKLSGYHSNTGLTGRVGFRCASPDKLPIIGPVPVYDQFCTDYAALRHDAKIKINTTPTHHNGLFANLAHGSKGLISGPISGEIIAAMLEGEPLPLEKELIEKLNPARFIIKNLIRRTI